MKKFASITLLLLIQVAFIASQQTPCKNLCQSNQVVSWLGGTMKITDFDPESLQNNIPQNNNIFLYCCDQNQSIKGISIPDGIQSTLLDEGQFSDTVTISSSSSDYEDSFDFNLGISGSYGFLKGALNLNYKSEQSKITYQNSQIMKYSYYYKNFQLSISDFSQLYLSQQLIDDLNSLPQNYTYSNISQRQAYFDFLNKYGTHISQSITVGGYIQAQTIIENSGSSSSSSDSYGAQLSASFASAVKIGNLQPLNITPSFSDSSSSSSSNQQQTYKATIQQIGGKPSFTDLNDYVSSLGDMPGCISSQAVEISSIFLAKNVPFFVNNYQNIKLNIQDALSDYFNQWGCTIPYAINYNSSAIQDDGSCYVLYYYGSYAQGSCGLFEDNYFDDNQLACESGFQPIQIGSYNYINWQSVDPDDFSNCRDYNDMKAAQCQSNIYLCASTDIPNMLSGYMTCDNNYITQNNFYTGQTNCPEGTEQHLIYHYYAINYYDSGNSCSTFFKEDYFYSFNCQVFICIHPQYNQIQTAVLSGSITDYSSSTYSFSEDSNCPSNTFQDYFVRFVSQFGNQVSNTTGYLCIQKPPTQQAVSQ